MESLISLWRRSTENRTVSLSVCAGVVVLGVLLIAIGEIEDWGWTRLIGAGIISTGSVLFGVLVGWSEPVRPRLVESLRAWSRSIILVLAAIMIAPLMVGLTIAFGGLFTNDASGDALLLTTGVIVIALMLGTTAVAVWLAVSLALRGIRRTSSPDAAGENGQEDA